MDPGSRKTGVGIVDIAGPRSRYVFSGVIRVEKYTPPERLRRIFNSMNELIAQYRPDALAIEKVFVHKDPVAAIKLGQARGVILCAAALAEVPIFEYTPTQIKGVVVGKGHAAKGQIQFMVQQLLRLSETPQEDAADALACALCHARFASLKVDVTRLGGARRRF
ncbi:crossover junction endodeoxyribonuclease RuvC [Sulfurivirga sp.]|uniref:crossover junction endodeoxyribonuclease RuvC n=1 Tax=Sulfurivirga sp. TaxID=2614236 RepID=UPI00345BE8A7